MRVSSYIIPTKVDDDKYMLVHGYSGAIDLVDAETADFLCFNNDVDRILEHKLDDETISFLQSRGYLTERTSIEEMEYIERMLKVLHKKSLMTEANFTFLVSYNCNFRCSYCFEKSDGWSLKGHTMTVDNVDKAYTVIDKLIHERSMTSKSITLFGGEPLLKENLPIVEYIVKEGVRRGIVFGAITNGYDLNHFEHLLSKNHIRKLQITLDGYDEFHNMKRPHKDGIPTFFQIIENIKLALQKNITVSVRLNLDKINQGEATKLQKYFEEIGILANPNFNFSIARLINHSNSDTTKSFLTQKEFNCQSDNPQYSELHLQDFSIQSILQNAITKGQPLRYKATFCKSQITGYTFDPFYNIYPCWEVVGKPESQIGNYRTGVVEWNMEVKNHWHNANALKYESCVKCPSILLCGGGCLAKNATSHHCIQVPQLINNAARKVYQNIIINKNG